MIMSLHHCHLHLRPHRHPPHRMNQTPRDQHLLWWNRSLVHPIPQARQTKGLKATRAKRATRETREMRGTRPTTAHTCNHT
jgi:hypothetical protein